MTGAGALILAAGQSRRYGCDKRLQQLGSGMTLLEASVQLYLDLLPEVLVTLRADDFALSESLQAKFPRLSVFLAPNSAKGMGSSLADAASSGLLDTWECILLGLGDMPFVSRRTLLLLLAAFEPGEARVLRPVFEGRPGHPVLFDPSCLDSLSQLSGEAGAAAWLRTSALQQLSVSDPGVVQDIDAPEDLARLSQLD